MESLDGLIDAITELMMVFKEAQSSLSKRIILERKNLQFLLMEVENVHSFHQNQLSIFEDPNLKERMRKSNDDVRDAASRLNNLVSSQSSSQLERSIYPKLHEELKNMLQAILIQLQVIDQHNSNLVLKQCKKTVASLARLRTTESAKAVEIVGAEITKLGEDLLYALQKRMAETTDPNIRQKFSHSISVLETDIPLCIHKFKMSFQSPSDSVNQEKTQVFKNVVAALQEAVNAVEETARYIKSYLLSFGFPEGTFDIPQQTEVPQIRKELLELEAAAKRGDTPGVLKAAKSLVGEVAKQKKRVQAAQVSPQKKKELERLIAELEQMVPGIIATAKQVAENPNDSAAKKKLRDLIHQAEAKNQRIEDLLQVEKELIDGDKRLNAMLAKLASANVCRNPDEAIKNARLAADEIKRQIELGKKAQALANDPYYKKVIGDAVEALERLNPQIVRAIKDVIENPNDEAAKKRLDDLLQQAREESAKIVTALLEDKLATNNRLLRGDLGELYTAVKKGDKTEAEKRLNDILNNMKRRVELGRQLADQIDDPILKKQILEGCDKLEALIPKLEKAVKVALDNPTPENLKKLRDIIEEIRDTSDRITAAKKFPTDKKALTAMKIKDTAASINSHLDTIAEAVANRDEELTASTAKLLGDDIERQVSLAKDHASTLDPASKKKVLDAAKDLEESFPEIVSSSKSALADPDNASHKKKLDDAINKAKKANQTIADSTVEKKQGKYSEFKPDGSRDEIMVAAHQVTDAISKTKGVSAEHTSLLEIAEGIGAEMEQLSLAAQRGSKQDMIASARKIAEMISKVQQFSNEIAAKCKDRILKEQLLSVCKVPKNFAVQLKIIAAVKSSSIDNDPAAEAQLVTCARGLANSVIQTVQAAQAAAIKAKQLDGNCRTTWQ